MNIDDILNMAIDELKPPPPTPEGIWRLQAKRGFITQPRDASTSPRAVFIYKPVEPIEVDPDELAALEPDALEAAEVQFSMWLDDPRALLVDVPMHLRKHEGADLEGSLREVLQRGIRGSEVIAEVYHRRYTNSAGDEVVSVEARNFRRPD